MRSLLNTLRTVFYTIPVASVCVVLFGLNVRYGGVGSILGAILFAELIGWTIRFRHIAPLFEFLTHGVTALAHAGDRSAVSLEKLKETRERVRGDLAAKEAPPVDSGADSPSAPRRRAKRRYDVGEGGGAAPAGDLDEALGGAQADAGPTPARPPGAKDDQPEQTEGTTSRLLRAKRRKRPDDE